MKNKDFVTTQCSDKRFACKAHDYYYAHGKLQEDLGFDILIFNTEKYGSQPSFEGIYELKSGRKKCTLFAWTTNSPLPGSRKGLVVYNSDKEAYQKALISFNSRKVFL